MNSSAGTGEMRDGKERSTYKLVSALAAISFICSSCAVPMEKADLGENQTKEKAAGKSEAETEAGPVLAKAASGLPRGGGYQKVGRPYQIKGRWYRPKQDADYSTVGAASWYGDAFHGQLTANGEVYDMTHLTAAHPTLPLPSYARVTNLKNKSSVIVRVNDRGPFAKGRVIDLSKRAAELLNYKQSGVAKVRVEYVGPAPLHGKDDRYLLASYQPGEADRLPAGVSDSVLVAMNENQVQQPAPAAARAFSAISKSDQASVALPQTGPVIPDRPAAVQPGPASGKLALLSYAGQQRETPVPQAFDALASSSRKRASADNSAHKHFINLGVWSGDDQIRDFRSELADMGRIKVEEVAGQNELYSLSLMPADRQELNTALRAAWAAGASGAFIVRN